MFFLHFSPFFRCLKCHISGPVVMILSLVPGHVTGTGTGTPGIGTPGVGTPIGGIGTPVAGGVHTLLG